MVKEMMDLVSPAGRVVTDQDHIITSRHIITHFRHLQPLHTLQTPALVAIISTCRQIVQHLQWLLQQAPAPDVTDFMSNFYILSAHIYNMSSDNVLLLTVLMRCALLGINHLLDIPTA